MFAYIIKRLLAGLVVVIIVSMAVFALFWYGPRDPAAPLCHADYGIKCDAERQAMYHEKMGFNEPIYEQYGVWVKGIFAGRELNLGPDAYPCAAPCFGVNYRTKSLITDEFKAKFPATLSLALGGAGLYALIGITVGTLAARRRGTLADRILVSGTLIMSSIPYYLIALLAAIYFTIVYSVFDSTQYNPITENPWTWFTGLLLPWLVLGLYGSTAYTRFARGSMVEALSEDYIRTAKSKGLSQRKVTFKHGLRAAIVPVVTIFGLDLATLLAGTVFTEQIFGINGIGKWGLDATYDRNLPVVSTVVLLASVAIVISNILVDIVYSILDPRVRLS